MKSFFDTSVLIPTFLEDHEHHEASFAAFLKADKQHTCCAAHSLAEVCSAVTRLPGNHRLSGDQAFLFVQAIYDRLKVVSLNAQEYSAAIEEAATRGIVGGMIYDMLLAQCALKAKAVTIYTWNVNHFQRLGPEIARRTKTP